MCVCCLQAIAHLQRELKQPFLSSGTKQNLQSEIQWRETAINDNKRAIIKYQEEINERQSAFRLLNGKNKFKSHSKKN